jgi:hypothetical protein
MNETAGTTQKGDAADLMRSSGEAALWEQLVSALAALRLQSLAEEPLMLGKGRLGRPEWTGCYALDWEILVYRQEECWEACFFKGELHHEHLKARSLDDARSKAEERINSIKLNNLQSTTTRRNGSRVERVQKRRKNERPKRGAGAPPPSSVLVS